MFPSQLLLPVKPSEAVALADLILKMTQGKVWSNDLRGRIGSSLPTLTLEKMVPLVQTLTPDAAHPSTYFIVVRSTAGDEARHWLLHMTPASAPTTALFPKPILIARVRPAGEREIVVNAVPVEENLPTIVRSLHPQLLARTSSVHHLWSLPVEGDLPRLWKEMPKRPNLLPAVRSTVAGWDAYLSLLVSGWRDGFVNVLEGLHDAPTAEEAEPFSRFSFCMDKDLDARAVAEFYRALKAGVQRSFDLELDLSAHASLDVEALHILLDHLRLLNVPVQSIELHQDLHLSAFSVLLQARKLGLTVRSRQPETFVSGVRTHWKLAELP